MPEVQRSGIYRNSKTHHAYWLRRGFVVSDEIAANYALDTDAELSDVQAAIVGAEASGTPLNPIPFRVFGTPDSSGDHAPVTPESIQTAPGSNEPVTSREVTTTGESEESPEPVDVAPGGRRSRKRPKGMQTPEDGEDAPQTPEDGDEDPETRDSGDEGEDN